jgi:hypothetical protein
MSAIAEYTESLQAEIRVPIMRPQSLAMYLKKKPAG